MKKFKKVMALGLATLSLTGVSTSVFAGETTLTTQEKQLHKNYVNLEGFSNFTKEQLENLANDVSITLNPTQIQEFTLTNMRTNTEHIEMVESGAVLDEVTITPYVVENTTNYGKDYVVTNRYKQSTTTDKEYVEKWWNSATNNSGPIEFILGQAMDSTLLKVLLYPLSFFGISPNISNMADYYSSGWVSLQNATNYYVKTAYVYDADRKQNFSGASARGCFTSLFSETRWRENGQEKRENRDEYLNYKSKNFAMPNEAVVATKDKELIRLAKIYYKDDFYNEYPSIPSLVNLD